MKHVIGIAMAGLAWAAAYGDWIQANGPTEYMPDKLAAAGDTLWMSTEGVVFRSTDHARSWQPAGEGLPAGRVYALAAGFGNVFAGTAKGLFRRRPSSGNWIAAGSGLPAGAMGKVAVGNALYASNGDSVFRSRDTGATWTALGGKFSRSLKRICATGDQVFALNDDSLYASDDQGDHWHSIVKPPDQPYRIDNLLAANGIVFATAFGWHSTIDSGKTWIELDMESFNSISSVAFMGKQLFLGTDIGIFVSDDSGKQIRSGSNTFNYPEITDMAAYPGGIAVASNLGLQWWDGKPDTYAHFGLQGLLARGVSVMQFFRGGLLAGGDRLAYAGDSGGYFWNAFRDRLAQDPPMRVGGIAVQGDSVFIGSAEGGIRCYANAGSDYPAKQFGNRPVYALASFRGRLFAGSDSGVFRSEDSGRKWILGAGFPAQAARLLAQAGSRLIAATESGGFYASEDSGANWKTFGSNWTGGRPDCLWVEGENLLAGGSMGLFRIPAQGGVWSAMTPPYPGAEVTALAYGFGYLIAGTPNGPYISGNDGAIWSNVTGGLGDKHILSVAVSRNFLLVGTADSGIWRLYSPELKTVAKLSSPSPHIRDFALLTATATRGGRVLLRARRGGEAAFHLRDGGGRRIQSWAPGRLASGITSLDLDPALAPGRYFLEIRSAGVSDAVMLPILP